jgi:hypothetical protein
MNAVKITGPDTRMIGIDLNAFAHVRGEPIAARIEDGCVKVSGTALQERIASLDGKRVIILELVE